jgi:hypothetical protein
MPLVPRMEVREAPQTPQKIVTYNAANVGVQPLPDGTVVLFVDVPGERAQIPLTRDAAQIIGKGLLAPSVAVPGQNGHGAG